MVKITLKEINHYSKLALTSVGLTSIGLTSAGLTSEGLTAPLSQDAVLSPPQVSLQKKLAHGTYFLYNIMWTI